MSRNRRIYIGKLSSRTRERDVEDQFSKYGKINAVDLKRGYAFVEYDDERDADDAVRAMDGIEMDGARIIVEVSHGGRDRRGPSNDECFSCGGRGHWARDCPSGRDGRGGRGGGGGGRRGGGGGYGRSRSRSPRGRYSSSHRRYSRSRSPSPAARKGRESRSRSPPPASKSSPPRSPAASKPTGSPSPKRAVDGSRSPPRKENGNDKSPMND